MKAWLHRLVCLVRDTCSAFDRESDTFIQELRHQRRESERATRDLSQALAPPFWRQGDPP